MKLKIENERTTTESTVNSNEPNQERYSKSSQPNKASGTKKRINKCDLGIDFVPPDGGWGWLVVIAAGCSNVGNVFILFFYNDTRKDNSASVLKKKQ